MNNKYGKQPCKVAFYIRVSTEDQVEKFGVDLQKQSLTALIKSKGKLDDGKTDLMTFAGANYVYIDEGISGTIPINERPEFSRLQEDILMSEGGNRPFDAVAVYKIDRFARKLKILLEAIDFFEDHDIKFLSANESIDTSTPFGRAILGIVGVLAELELETIKQRTEEGKHQAKRTGTSTGSNPIYGFIKDEHKRPIILEKEAVVVREIFDSFVDMGMTTHAIATMLTKRKEPSPSASAVINKKRSGTIRKKNEIHLWRSNQIRKMLMDEMYIGNFYYNKFKKGKLLPKAEWKLSEYKPEHIISEIKFTEAQRLLGKRSSKGRSRPIKEENYLLSSLVKCSACFDIKTDKDYYSWHGTRKKISKNSKKYSYYYQCGRKKGDKSSIKCHTIPLPGDQLDAYVVERITEILDNPQAVFKYQNELRSSKLAKERLEKDFKHWNTLLDGLPNKKQRLIDLNTEGLLNNSELKERLNNLQTDKTRYSEQLKKLEQRMEKYQNTDIYLKTLDMFKDAYIQVLKDFNKNRLEAKNILSTIIDRIVIHSRPVKDTDIIAGRRTEKQTIPWAIDIELKLPYQLLEEISNKEKGKPDSYVSGIDLDPRDTSEFVDKFTTW